MNLQQQSALLQLPGELREQIWTDVFSTPRLTIRFWDYPTSPTSPRKNFPYTTCGSKRPLYHLGQEHDCSHPRECSKFMPNVRYMKHVLRDRLGLSLTCWMVYHESIHLLYTQHTFQFPNGIALPDLQKHLSPFKFHQIRAVTLAFNMTDLETLRGGKNSFKSDTRCNLWRLLSSMQGLKHLKVEIQITYQDLVHSTTEELAAQMNFLLEPLAAVERPGVFEVRVTGFGISENFLEGLRKRVGKRFVPFRIVGEE
ncbi:hypothetical protein BDZ45DRAFT_249605 [Acephala macrosclerotiorum]|nr:hypothetical protein BDZ45DRAFT_249605 [Acephala macrosclerotiorum]